LNKISGEWDFIKLKDVLTDIDTGDFDIELTGFDLDEIGKLIAFEPGEANVNDLLNELDIKSASRKPIWVVIRTDTENLEILEDAIVPLEKTGIVVERSYERR
jgi:hypothetical protein